MRLGRMITTTALSAAAVLFSASALAQDAVQAGVSAAVRGDVQIARADAVGRQVNSGEAIFLRDAIASGPDGGMQILLLDETVFTIGPESEISIDEFVYDPTVGEGSLAANMVKGTMRFVTGNIAAGTPENMSIKLPVGTIGIRGTNGVVSVLTQGQAQQQFPEQANQLGGGPGQPVIFAALNGPGPLSNAGAGTGSFNFSTPNGDVDLNRPGAAVLATPGLPPVFFLAPPGTIQQVTNGLRSGGTRDQGEGQGDTPGGGVVTQSGIGNDASFSQATNFSQDTAPQTNADDITGPIVNTSSATTFQDIANNFGGGTASGSGSITGPISGTFNTFIDFGARTVDVQTGTLSQGGSTIGTVILNNGDGVAVNAGATGFGIDASNNTGTCSSCTGSVAFSSPNSMVLSVTHNGETGTGSATYGN